MTKKALLIIDHGSKRESANAMLGDVVALLRQQRPELIIHGAHMELAAPSIADGVQACVDDNATHIVAHPYMLSPGRHSMEDIPKMVNDALLRHDGVTGEVTAPLGVDISLAELILKRANL